MEYSEALNVIQKKQSLGIKPGLCRVAELLDVMGNPQNKLKIIHIAGTNGKGTVGRMIADALKNHGFKTGLFSSPWVTDYREQIQINGVMIKEKVFADYICRYGSCDATEFELLTAVMYKYFYDEKVDYAVVECGMGGLEDSTNAVNRTKICVITSVSWDHTDFLGKSLEEIANHKAGIIKDKSKVVLYPNSETRRIFEDKCRDRNAELVKVEEQGSFMLNNIKTAEAVLKLLEVDEKINIPSLPARQEMICENLMLDGAHNTDGARALAGALPEKRITAVLGMLQDKDIDSYLSVIAPLCSKIITTTIPSPRAETAKNLKNTAKKYCAHVISAENPFEAVKMLDGEFNLVCGSFYLARAVRKDLISNNKIR